MQNLDPDKIIFYDIETDFQWAPYAELQMVGYQVGFDTEPKILDLRDNIQTTWFKETLASPEWTKVHFNGINFDEIVLNRYGYWTNPINRHDVYLMIKTCSPLLPAYGLKFLNCYFYMDWHEPERQLRGWCLLNGKEPSEAPQEFREAYCKYDVTQTIRLFNRYWSIVNRPLHWTAYSGIELPFGEVLHEMMMDGGDYVDPVQIVDKISELTDVNSDLEEEAKELTEGQVTNPNSTKQVAEWLKYFEQVDLEISQKGNLICRKDDLLTLLDLDDPNNDTSRLARVCFEIRGNTKQIGYLRAFYRAAQHELELDENRNFYSQWKCVKIPKSYNLSTARTRRFTSSSKYGLNFQNQDKHSKFIELNPPEWITFSIDLSQIENVVHIFESKDIARQKAYEQDPEFNEYVWLGNQILGTNMNKKEMDSQPSPVNNKWTLYKQFKTVKLAMNFGMGTNSFAEKNGLSHYEAKQLYETIHKACPAIRNLQRRVESDLLRFGYVQDPFGHIYSGKEAYKVVAYLIQGCGTGSVPKAIARAIYDILHGCFPSGTAHLCGLVHDEIQFRIHLSQSSTNIANAVRECFDACTKRFNHLFAGIPIRCKLYITKTNLADLKEIQPWEIESELTEC